MKRKVAKRKGTEIYCETGDRDFAPHPAAS